MMFQDRGFSKRHWQLTEGNEMNIRTVAVIGAGTMGAGIAQICAQAGWKTNLHDAFPEGLDRGMARIDSFWNKGIERGKTTPDQKKEWESNLHRSNSLESAVSEADLIIEAVPEILELKQEIFSKIDAHAPEHAILGTNTSGLSIHEIASVTQRPNRVIGMHFFNPVPIMSLLELIKHEETSEDTISQAQLIAENLGKTAILVRDVPGFATSRLGVVLGNEAIRMLADGVASARDIDAAMCLGYRHPMGPLELTDLVGLDVRCNILNNLADAFGDERYRPHPLLIRLVEEGSLGKKSGMGIYDWSSGEKVDRHHDL